MKERNKEREDAYRRRQMQAFRGHPLSRGFERDDWDAERCANEGGEGAAEGVADYPDIGIWIHV